MLVENPRPDLIIQSIVSGPAVPQAGENLNFTITVMNQGTVPSGEALATYYINSEVPGKDISIQSLSQGASIDLIIFFGPRSS